MKIEDLRVGAAPQIVIGVVFQIDKSKEYLIDPERKTSLEAEYLLNEDGLLEIRKIWDCIKSLTAKSLTSYIVANYLKEFSEDLKITDLKKICTVMQMLQINEFYQISEKRYIILFRIKKNN